MTAGLTQTTKPPSDQLGAAEMTELLASVNSVTHRLQDSHVALRQQVDRLQNELAQANARLQRSRSLAALGEMAAGIAHEVRNPLASIQLYVQLLRDDVADRPEQAALCENISGAIGRLDSIVADVLAFARDTRIVPDRIAAGDLVRRALTMCDSMIAEAGVAIDFDDPMESVELSVDPNLATQAMANVLRNAMEAMTESGVTNPGIRISICREQRRVADGVRLPRVVFAVDDEGPGIKQDVARRMFNPFFTTRPSGTGLGLAIVHRIIDAHGGEVVVGDRPGPGARIELCFPDRDEMAIVEAAQVKPDSDSRFMIGENDDGVSLHEAVRRRIGTERST